MRYNSVVFVDFDGPLRPFKYTEVCESLWRENPACKTRDEWGYYFAPWSVDALRYILAVTGAGIVVSSDWRKNGLTGIKEMWAQRGLPFPERLIGLTPILESTRGYEISAWLKENPKTKHYVIIDDISDMGQDHDDHLVLVEKKYGLNMTLAEKCIEVLKIEKIKM